MDFGSAISAIRAGNRLARSGWNGKSMFVFLVPGSTFTVNREPLASILGVGTQVQYRGHIDLKAADGSIAVWNPSQVDMLADDWWIVKD
jgi:hypothetical protein